MAEFEEGQAPEPEIYKEAKRPITNRVPVLNRLLQRNDKISGITSEDTSQRTITRRELLRLGGTAAKIVGAVGVLKAIDYFHVDKLLNPEYRGKDTEAEKEEARLLYLFNGANGQTNDGLDILAKDLAIAAMGRNKDNYQPVDFMNRSTWGSYSELTIFTNALKKFFEDIATTEGREKLKQNIAKYEGENKEDYFLRLKKLEDYLQKKQLSSPVSEDELRTFFSAPSEGGGLGYLREDTAFIFDLLKASRANQFTPELKVRINQINEKSGTRFRIP